METEIFEQPQIIEHLIKTYIDANNDINIDVPKDIEKLFLLQAVHHITAQGLRQICSVILPPLKPALCIQANFF